MNFIAIDFETANMRSDSACQIGITTVLNNQIADTSSWLIKPPYGGFNPKYIDIHGITPNDIISKPMFDDLWNIIKHYFYKTNLLIAHNASFDTNVLFNTLKCFELNVPKLNIACTISMARRTWLNEQSYSLKALSKKLNINFTHHDAGDDSKACAEIAINIFKEKELDSISLNENNVNFVEERLGIKFGSIDEYGYNNCKVSVKIKK